MADDLPTVSGQLATLRDQVEALTRALALGNVQPASREERLVISLRSAFPRRGVFTSVHAVERSTTDVILRLALEAYEISGPTAALKLGARLRGIAGRSIAGLCVERIDRDRAGCAWCIRDDEGSSSHHLHQHP